MKKIMLFILTFISINVYAQTDSSGANKAATRVSIHPPQGQYAKLISDQPLIILDGVALKTETEAAFKSEMGKIDPESIEQIDVLKDKSATAIYGARGANGVILITSKKKKKD
jgi:TonB-dependent SusC/RagA subfamily outer membrane receptor